MELDEINKKRERSVDFNNLEATDSNEKVKVPNLNRSKIHDFECPMYHNGIIYKSVHLSDLFQKATHAILFFCPLDFSPQSKQDLSHIEEHFLKFVQNGALPIVITHDQPRIHFYYATPGRTTSSLSFVPSFMLASDSVDKLISTSFKSINFDTLEMIRSVVIIDKNLQILYSHQVPPHRYFPIQAILNCFIP
ncbi:hypothetical protein BD770DRAFT_459133 [Pilaira anomala]|nr:hypothetical protein BD770DRAFT_459133 [Pilaira anomala]